MADLIINGIIQNFFQSLQDLKEFKWSTKEKRRTTITFTCETCGKETTARLRTILEKEHLTCGGCEYRKSGGFEKSRKTMLERYGIDNPSKSDVFLNKREQTVLDKYGAKSVLQVKSIREKGKESKLEIYGDENYNNPEKRIQTSTQIYGEDNYMNRKKAKETCKKKFGAATPFESPEIRKKSQETLQSKYGVANSFEIPEVISQISHSKKISSEADPLYYDKIAAKRQQTCLETYGWRTYFESFDFHPWKHYSYDYLDFDSSWELAYYIWSKDNSIDIIRNTKTCFTYDYEGKTHRFYPDFIISDQFIEIKGSHLTKKPMWEEKKACAEKNHVVILYDDDIKPVLKYISEKYGKAYLKSFLR